MATKKLCKTCGKKKKLKKFNKSKVRENGFESQCKTCRNAYHRLNSSRPCTGKIRYKRLKKWSPLDKVKLNKKGEITVVCKMCGKRMVPTVTQVSSRLESLKGTMTGENNFYCSDECKNVCPVFNFHPDKQIDPRSKKYIPPTEQQEARACQTDDLKQLQCDEHGYNYCERCGDIIDVELHHTQPVATNGKAAINSAGHILLCAGCHYELHHDCKM